MACAGGGPGGLYGADDGGASTADLGRGAPRGDAGALRDGGARYDGGFSPAGDPSAGASPALEAGAAQEAGAPYDAGVIEQCSASGGCSTGTQLDFCSIVTNNGNGTCLSSRFRSGSTSVPCASCADCTDAEAKAVASCEGVADAGANVPGCTLLEACCNATKFPASSHTFCVNQVANAKGISGGGMFCRQHYVSFRSYGWCD